MQDVSKIVNPVPAQTCPDTLAAGVTIRGEPSGNHYLPKPTFLIHKMTVTVFTMHASGIIIIVKPPSRDINCKVHTNLSYKREMMRSSNLYL